MSKLYKQPVEIRMSGEALSAFLWRGKWLKVESSTRIVQRRDPYDPYYELETYRVVTQGDGVYELVKDGANWVLERLWD